MRTRRRRHVCWRPDVLLFKPAGIKRHNLEEVIITLEEYEAMRLVDIEGASMQMWADAMKTSPATFNRLVKSAHSKIANAIVYWKIIKIDNQNDVS